MIHFNELKVKAKTTWYGTSVFEVVKLEYESTKPPAFISETVLFTGTLTACKDYLYLLERDKIL